MNIIIAPSILSCDFTHLADEVKKFDSVSNIWFHLDIMDGHFVPNLTFGATVIHNLSKHTSHKLDAHFMVTNPRHYLKDFRNTNIHNFTFHYEATNNPIDLIKEIKDIFPSVGISIKPGTPVEVLTDDILELVDLVLIMSVEPGFGGQKYIQGSENKVLYLANKRRSNKLNFKIEVDGGINEETAQTVINSGADIIVAGSFIFKSRHYPDQIEKLRI